MKYKVLLIDDQHLDESIQQFIYLAELDEIEIDSVAYHKEGIDLLKGDILHEYQAVILDATGFKEASDSYKEVNNVGVRYSLNELKDMSSTRLIPWFIYTGAPRNVDNQEFEDEIRMYQEYVKFGRDEKVFYTKTLDEQELLDDIINAIEGSIELQMMHKYKDVCLAVKGLKLDQDAHVKILSMFHDLESDCKNIIIQDKFTPIRKVIEKLFSVLGSMCIIDPILSENGKITACSKLLCNRNEDYKRSRISIQPIIQELLQRLLFITQDSSHSEGNLVLKVNEFYNCNSGVYLYKSCLYNLFEIIIYFENFIKENADIEINKSRWKEQEEIHIDLDDLRGFSQEVNATESIIKNPEVLLKVGTIVEVTENSTAYFLPDRSTKKLFIPTKFIEEYSLKEGQRLSISYFVKKVEQNWIVKIEELYN